MLTFLLRASRRFLKGNDGPTAVEYAVMLALIIVVCIGAVTSLGGNVSGAFSAVVAAFGGGSASASGGGSASASGSNPGSGIGGTFAGGTSESSGTYTFTEGGNQATYNASTGQVTVTDSQGNSGTGQLPPGTLPDLPPGQVWTKAS